MRSVYAFLVVLLLGSAALAVEQGFVVQWYDANGTLQSARTSTPLPVANVPTARTLVPLDVATVTTGGVAVTAIAAGHRTAGGWIYNPTAATVNLCINEVTTAACTSSSGSCTCILPGTTYNLAPSGNAVSVITADSAHPFSGIGLQ